MVDYEWRINILEDIYQTQKELADSLGVSARSIRNWKSGNTDPSSGNRNKLNSRWNYFKKRLGLYRYQEIKATDPDTGEEIILKHRTDLTDMDSFEDVIEEQDDTLMRWEESADERGYTDFEVVKSEVKVQPFQGFENMRVLQ